jgi:C-terminal processing protease CtpA/Prc
VVVLTNRSTFSAGNNFVMYVKDLPNVTLVGDRTGGGAGMPFQSELPNGWSVRFSACPIYDAGMQLTEDGIEPDVRVDITSADYQRSRDTIIERAIDIILSSK